MSTALLIKTLDDMSLDPGYVTSDPSPSFSGSPHSRSPQRGSWWQHTGSWDTVHSLDDSKHPSLPELEDYPWTEDDLRGVLRKVSHLFTADAIQRLSLLLRRALVRLSREAQRLSELHQRCTRLEVQSAAKLVLSWTLAERCVSSAVRAESLHCMSSGDVAQQRGKSARCGLALSVGRFFRWMVETRVSVRVHDQAALCLTACVETLAEEVAGRALRAAGRQEVAGGDGVREGLVTVELLEGTVNSDPELWGVLQGCQHLVCGRDVHGEVSLTSHIRAKTASLEDSYVQLELQSLEQALLASGVGSIAELSDLVTRAMHHMHHLRGSSLTCSRSTSQLSLSWAPDALRCLYYFLSSARAEPVERMDLECPTMILRLDRHSLVLPPIMEWIRVAVVTAEHRCSLLVDSDDVRQAARLLLPGLDCEPRQLRSESCFQSIKCLNAAAAAAKFHLVLGFKMLSSGRADLVPQALQLLGEQGVDTVDDQGMSPLMYAAAAGDEALVQMIIEAGANLDLQVPSCSSKHPSVHPGTRHWVALTFAVLQSHLSVTQLLLDAGADVEGGALLDGRESSAETPLQLASAAGHYEMVSLLLSHGADPLLRVHHGSSLSSPLYEDMNCFSYAAAHGHRNVLRRLLLQHRKDDILSLEEILAEGVEEESTQPSLRPAPRLCKARMKALQQAAYYSAEHGYLDVTMELREMGVPWRLHVWLESLSRARQLSRDDVIASILAEFPSIRAEDYSQELVSRGIPLMFNMLQTSRDYGITKWLASSISHCYGCSDVPAILPLDVTLSTQLDVHFLNNQEMSDVTFMVDGKPFFAHRVLLMSASERFRQMLNDTSDSTICISHMTYSAFQLMMKSLYCGGTEGLTLTLTEAVKLLPAAKYFQLRSLQRICEMKLSQSLTLDNVVDIYQNSRHYQSPELRRYCEGFFLQNLDQLLDQEDFHRLLLCPENWPGQDQQLEHPDLLRELEVVLVHRLCSLHSACRE
ncbi:ankyrin repeat and BTB/POZ domain-containing protein 2-like [Synchiropus picturatus]